jgi:ribonuclease P protein component
VVNQGFTYPKALRLLQASEFKVVFDQPDCKTSCREFLLLVRFNNKTQPRLGLVIGKKSVRRAVARNLIKRVMREQFRLQQHALADLDLVLLARRGADALDSAQLATQLRQLMVDAAGKAARRRTAQSKPEEKTTAEPRLPDARDV